MEEGGETVFPDPSAKWANPRLEALAANYSQVWKKPCCTKKHAPFLTLPALLPLRPPLSARSGGRQ